MYKWQTHRAIDQAARETEHHSQAFGLSAYDRMCYGLCVCAYAGWGYAGEITMFTKQHRPILHMHRAPKKPMLDANAKCKTSTFITSMEYERSFVRVCARARVWVTQPDCNLIPRSWFSPYFLLLPSRAIQALPICSLVCCCCFGCQ